MSTQLNDLRLQLQRLDYESKEGKITVDILKDQNEELTKELEEVQKSLNELKVSTKDSAATEDKERKKAEKMALMMAKFDAVRLSESSERNVDLKGFAGASSKGH